ncbi:glycosyltransferase family 2 protein [Colwellia sp. 12G3]|uniref:glycosyltransferase family 2 protein n=1 Tax=Colwellia sp. 12G3 TaxID=2058299 RepID=UPI000C337A3B|nr:glycosyltransferase family 2 protein [Colwellia sp. 12G3]PKI18159.1 glucosyl transferase [Colwellia sp. 12G3]
MLANSIPVVSVVIPMYNVAKYIEQSINSVLQQSYHHFELILVDDGCVDDTLNIVNNFTDPRIRIVRQANRGLSGARNTGIEAARGIYIALLDADDYWAADKLTKHIKHLSANPKVGISYCPSLFINEDGELLGVGQFPKLKNITKQHIFCRNPVGNGSSPVIRRSVLSEVGYFGVNKDKYRRMYFDESLRQSEDIELWTRIALNTTWQFEGISQPLTYYRVNDSGLSSDVDKQFASWQHAVMLNKASDPTFFKQFYSLAKAYQLRYLARRAVQSKNKLSAFKLIHQAIYCDYRIIFQEPNRTIMTLCCAWLKFLPSKLYSRIEKFAMLNFGNSSIKH